MSERQSTCQKMQFTEKEIRFAKQLKEVGLEWKPKIGDHYIYDLEYNRDSIVTLIDFDRGDKGWIYVKSQLDGLRNINLCCWLPLWHQCRKIIEETEHYLLLLTKGNNVQIDLWTFDENRYVGVFRGETDLEVIYQALLNLLNYCMHKVQQQELVK